MPATFHNVIKYDMVVDEIECFGKIHQAYGKVWPNAQLPLNYTCMINMLSEVRQPARKPPLYLSCLLNASFTKLSLLLTIISNICSVIGKVAVPR